MWYIVTPQCCYAGIFIGRVFTAVSPTCFLKMNNLCWKGDLTLKPKASEPTSGTFQLHVRDLTQLPHLEGGNHNAVLCPVLHKRAVKVIHPHGEQLGEWQAPCR